jgi:hypothetical protein
MSHQNPEIAFPSPSPTPQNPVQSQPPTKKTGFATAALVLGIIGLVFAFIPIFGIFIAIPLGVLAVIFAVIGLVKKNKGLSIAGLITGALAILLSIVMFVAVYNVASAVSDAVNQASKSLDSTSGSDNSDAKTPKTATSDVPSFKDGVLTTSKMKIEITDHKIIQPGQAGNEYGDKPVIAFWYKVTNLSGAKLDPSSAWIMDITAYQDNNADAENKLDVGSLPDEKFLDSQLENIKKGGTVENAVSYELDDMTTPVKLVANDSFGISDDIGSMTYTLK